MQPAIFEHCFTRYRRREGQPWWRNQQAQRLKGEIAGGGLRISGAGRHGRVQSNGERTEMTQEARWGLVVRGLEVQAKELWIQSIYNEGLYVQTTGVVERSAGSRADWVRLEVRGLVKAPLEQSCRT